MTPITTLYTPSEHLIVLVREVGVYAKTRPAWEKGIDSIAEFAKLSDNDMAWLAGVRYLGNYIRPYV